MESDQFGRRGGTSKVARWSSRNLLVSVEQIDLEPRMLTQIEATGNGRAVGLYSQLEP